MSRMIRKSPPAIRQVGDQFYIHQAITRESTAFTGRRNREQFHEDNYWSFDLNGWRGDTKDATGFPTRETATEALNASQGDDTCGLNYQ